MPDVDKAPCGNAARRFQFMLCDPDKKINAARSARRDRAPTELKKKATDDRDPCS